MCFTVSRISNYLFLTVIYITGCNVTNDKDNEDIIIELIHTNICFQINKK